MHAVLYKLVIDFNMGTCWYCGIRSITLGLLIRLAPMACFKVIGMVDFAGFEIGSVIIYSYYLETLLAWIKGWMSVTQKSSSGSVFKITAEKTWSCCSMKINETDVASGLLYYNTRTSRRRKLGPSGWVSEIVFLTIHLFNGHQITSNAILNL